MNQMVQTTSTPIEMPSYQQAWEFALGQLRTETSRGDFDTWVKPIRPMGFKEHVYTLGVYNAYARDWVESRLKSRITQLLSGALQDRLSIRLVIMNGLFPGEEVFEAPPAAPAAAVDTPPVIQFQNGDTSPRKVMLQRAYGSERARLIQPERGMFVTLYFFINWLPLLGHSAADAILAARSMCYWNPMTGELRNTVEIEMRDLAKRASVSVRTIKDVLANPLVRRYFLRYKVRRVMTPNGIRTAGIILMVRMDDPLTPEDQQQNHLPEDERWYTADFENEEEDEEGI